MLDFRPHKLYIKSTAGGGEDENGFPVPVQDIWGDPIPCHISTDSRETIYKYPDGSATVFSYAVWTDPLSKEMIDYINDKHPFARLIDQSGQIVEKQVQKCINRQLRTKLYL